MSETRERLRATFDSVADRYDAARPSYPESLFDDLVALARLSPGDRLLEIGCATGKATRPLLERGFSIVCVELGAQLAERARRNLAGFALEVDVAPFEEWSGPNRAFDLVYAATAWHWLDPSVRYGKAHELLRRGGHLAFWSAHHAFPAGFDPFFTQIQDVYDAIGESHPGEWRPRRRSLSRMPPRRSGQAAASRTCRSAATSGRRPTRPTSTSASWTRSPVTWRWLRPRDNACTGRSAHESARARTDACAATGTRSCTWHDGVDRIRAR
jgi:SAM-dependent methyltransferase